MELDYGLDYMSYLFLLQHYSELPDIKRVIVNTHAIEPQVSLLHSPSYLVMYIKLRVYS